MPTENRSPNINASRALLEQLQLIASGKLGHINAGVCPDHVEGHEKRDKDCPACNALSELDSLLAQPTEEHQGEPIAWMVGSAIWWSKPEAEADADLVGEPVIPIGPLADTGEVERLRDALMDIARKASESRSVTRRLTWIEGRAQSALEGKAWAKHVFQMPDPLNSAPKAERLRAELANLRKLHDSACAQLTERDALLGSAKSALCHLLHNIKTSGKRIDLGLAKDSADTVITLINALQAEAKS